MVHAKEVARIVFFLQSDQPLVVRAVRFASDGLAFVGKVITVGDWDQERPKRYAAVTVPFEVFLRVCGALPHRPREQVP